MMRAAPGSPFEMSRKLPPEILAHVEAKFGLNRPLGEQYVDYLAGVAHGDFGPSLKYQDKSVLQIVGEGFPTSLTIGFSALVLASLVGVGLGVVAALRQNQGLDFAVMGVAVLGVCIPAFVFAPLMRQVFASDLGWVPTGGLNGPISLVMPVVVLALPQVAIISRLTRAGMIEVLRSNYIRTARAKGLPERTVILRHALRAAILPLISYLGPACAGLDHRLAGGGEDLQPAWPRQELRHQRPAARLYGGDGRDHPLRDPDHRAQPGRRPHRGGADPRVRLHDRRRARARFPIAGLAPWSARR